jgi:hypothetical protein
MNASLTRLYPDISYLSAANQMTVKEAAYNSACPTVFRYLHENQITA